MVFMFVLRTLFSYLHGFKFLFTPSFGLSVVLEMCGVIEDFFYFYFWDRCLGRDFMGSNDLRSVLKEEFRAFAACFYLLMG